MTDSLTLDPALMRRLESMSLVANGRLARQGQGERRSPYRGNSMQFVDYRAYSPGDDLRQIDWSVYGRSDELFVRLYEAEQVLTAHLLIDVSRSMDWGAPNKRRAALVLAQALGYVALCSYDRLAIGFVGERVFGTAGPFWGRRQSPLAFRALANAPDVDQTDLEASLGAYASRLRGATLIVLISDLLSESAEAGLKRLAGAGHEVAVLHMLAPDELDPAPLEEVHLVDRETGRGVDLTLDYAAIREYKARLREWLERIERLCRERGARYVRLTSADDLATTTLRQLQRAGVLR